MRGALKVRERHHVRTDTQEKIVMCQGRWGLGNVSTNQGEPRMLENLRRKMR